MDTHERTRVFLTGMMGSGKSTLGRQLAAAWGWRFHDVDELVATEAGMPVAALFAARGEAAFRAAEQAAVAQLLSAPLPQVVATGGGLPCHGDNAAWLNAHGVTVWLDVPAAELARRLAGQAPTRPLLQRNGHPLHGEDLRRHLEDLLAARAGCYAQAQIRVAGAALRWEDVAAALQAAGVR